MLLLDHIFVPEAVLFTHEQMNNAIKLYEQMDLTGNQILDFGVDRVNKYLDQIQREHKEIFSTQKSFHFDVTLIKMRAFR